MAGRLKTAGCSLVYGDTGAHGRAVVFLHGAGLDHVMFRAQAAAVAGAGYRAVIWDMRAHGLSRPNAEPLTADLLLADAEALISSLGLSRPVLVGHSLGGNLAQELVRRDPEAYEALVVVDSTWNAGPLGWTGRQLLRSAGPLLRLIPSGSLPALMANASAVTAPARADLRRAFAQIPKKEFLQVWGAAVDLVNPQPSYRTPVPLLLIRGSQDRTGNIASAMPAWAKHEGVTEVVIPQAGHVPAQDAPETTSAALMTFLESIEARP